MLVLKKLFATLHCCSCFQVICCQVYDCTYPMEMQHTENAIAVSHVVIHDSFSVSVCFVGHISETGRRTTCMIDTGEVLLNNTLRYR